MEELLLIRRTREENQGLRIEDQEQWREYRDYCWLEGVEKRIKNKNGGWKEIEGLLLIGGTREKNQG